MAEKPLIWLGDSRAVIRDFPEAARQVVGFQLWRVQRGLEPNDWKPMPSVGPGVQEIRIHAAGEHRVFYVAKFAEAVYVLHAFEKQTQRTPQDALDLARHRFRQLLHQRAHGKGR
jgi:phage-related protein